MKKLLSILLVSVLIISLSACAIPEKAEDPEKTMEILSEAEEITVHLYQGDEERTLKLLVTDELLSLTEGKWEKSASRPDGKKVLTLTVGTQHEITYFEDGTCMIYYGYASVFEKDRCYFNVTLDEGISQLYNWCCENGTVPETEE